MRRKTNGRAVRRAQRELKAELDQTISALRRNDAAFQLAVDGYQVEELIYQHAALMCHCRAVLRDLRGGDASCPSG